MKKLFIAGLFALALVTSAFASPNSVNKKAAEHFSLSFSKAKSVSWNTNDMFEKVSFQLDNEKVNAFYDTYGELLGMSRTMAFDKLPKAALETITTKYTFPDFKLTDCIAFTTNYDETNYYVSFDKTNETLILEINKAGKISVLSRTKK